MSNPQTKFGIEYIFDNDRWVFTIHAEGWTEAKKRLAAIAETGRVFGSDVEEAPEDELS